jgi:membrane fusion protein, multidrug efflux system
MRRRLLIPAVLLVIIAAGGVFAFRHEFAAKSASTAPAPAPVVAGTVAQHDVPIYLTGVGTVIAFNTDVCV